MALLEAAYDYGIRHFDVAPIYGLGIAEAELAEFVGKRTDVRIATKFGMRTTAVGRQLGKVQSSIRRALQSSPSLMTKLREPRSQRENQLVDQLLYTRRDFSVVNARESLFRSLRTLRTERIEYFFLHEPAGALTNSYHELVDFLEGERRSGVVGRWGPAGDLSRMDVNLAGLSECATALQIPYNLIDGYRGPRPERHEQSDTLTFGFVLTTLRLLEEMFVSNKGFRQKCSELLDADLSDRSNLVRLLIRDALLHNKFGTVLVSSTNIRHLEMACGAAGTPMRNEAEVAQMIRQRFQSETAS